MTITLRPRAPARALVDRVARQLRAVVLPVDSGHLIALANVDGSAEALRGAVVSACAGFAHHVEVGPAGDRELRRLEALSRLRANVPHDERALRDHFAALFPGGVVLTTRGAAALDGVPRVLRGRLLTDVERFLAGAPAASHRHEVYAYAPRGTVELIFIVDRRGTRPRDRQRFADDALLLSLSQGASPVLSETDR